MITCPQCPSIYKYSLHESQILFYQLNHWVPIIHQQFCKFKVSSTRHATGGRVTYLTYHLRSDSPPGIWAIIENHYQKQISFLLTKTTNLQPKLLNTPILHTHTYTFSRLNSTIHTGTLNQGQLFEPVSRIRIYATMFSCLMTNSQSCDM